MMANRIWQAAAVGCLAANVTLVALFATAQPAQSQAKPAVPRWEYKFVSNFTVTTEKDTEKAYNELGKEGWELAGVMRVRNPYDAIFKRRLPD